MFFKSVFFNFGSIFFQLIQQVRKIYLNSPIYNKKISKFDDKVIIYKPSQSILNCLINVDLPDSPVPNNKSFNSLRESCLSLRNCLSISALIRSCNSCSGDLQQQQQSIFQISMEDLYWILIGFELL